MPTLAQTAATKDTPTPTTASSVSAQPATRQAAAATTSSGQGNPLSNNSRTDYVWTNPTHLLVAAPLPSRSTPLLLDGTLPVALKPQFIILVPANPGDWVEATSEPLVPLQFGLAGGTDSSVDWLLWQDGIQTRLKVPSFSTANYVAIRTTHATTIQVKQSTTLDEPVEWFEMDQRVARWLFSDGPQPLSLRDRRRELRTSAQMSGLIETIGELRASLTTVVYPELGHLLYAFWLEESLKLRPIVGPFFVPVGADNPARTYVINAPKTLTFRDPGALHRLRVRGFGNATLAIYEGSSIARNLRFNHPTGSRPRWSDERHVRTVAGSHRCAPVPTTDTAKSPSDQFSSVADCDRELRLEVPQGSIALSYEAFSPRDEYTSIFGRFSRSIREHWLQALTSPNPWISSLARAKLERPESATFDANTVLAALSPNDKKETHTLRDFLNYEASLLSENLTQATRFAFSALRYSRSEYLRAAAAIRLVDLALDDDSELERQALLTDADNKDLSPQAPDLFDGRSLESLLRPTRLGLRPEAGERLENWASSQIGNSGAARLATAYWKSFDYRYVPPELGATTLTRLLPLPEVGQCQQSAGDSTRWLMVDKEPVVLDIQLPDQLYALSNLVPLSNVPIPEGYVLIDDLPIAIHAGAGLPSSVALASGTHKIASPPGGPAVALEMTTGMSASCSSLRRKQVWTKLDAQRKVRFSLPAPGASSVVQIRVETPIPNTQVYVVLGQRRQVLSLRTAGAHTIEVLAASGDESIELTSPSDVFVNVSMRRQADPESIPKRLFTNTSASLSKGSFANPSTGTNVKEQLLLAKIPELRRLSAALHTATTDTERSRLSETRAALLIELGYRQLALRDIAVLPGMAEGIDFAYLSGVSATVVPVGFLSQLPPLLLPPSNDRLISRRAQRQIDGDIGCSTSIDDELVTRGDAESLLAAYCAERAAQPALAARLYETIARKTGDGSAFLRAAALHADTAIDGANLKPSLRAAIVATYATLHGADATELWARLKPAISWTTASVLEGTNGYVTLVKTGNREPTAKDRVLSALSLADPMSLLVEPNELAELILDNHRNRTLIVEYGCDDGRGSTCQLQTRVDGFEVPCRIFGKNRCETTIPIGQHRIELGFLGNAPFGWVKLDPSNQSLTPLVRSRFFSLTANEPATLTIKGPTVLRFRLRSRGLSTRPIAAGTVQLTGCGIPSQLSRIELPTTTDPTAKPSPEDTATQFSTEQVVDAAVDSDSRCLLSLLASKTDTLVQVSLARATGLPNARLEPNRSAAQLTETVNAPSPSLTSTSLRVFPVDATEGLPLYLGLRTRFLSESLNAITEQDSSNSEKPFHDVFLETSAVVARELVESRFWGSAQIGTRFRTGPMTRLARFAITLPPNPRLPGIDLQTTAYNQTLDGNAFTSVNSSARVSMLLTTNKNQDWIPQVGYATILSPKKPSENVVVDGDVYSNYNEKHPRYGTADVTYRLRPFVDTLTIFDVSARSLPAFEGLDRVTGSANVLFLPINDWPLLLSTAWSSSIRPESELRDQFFVRHQFEIAGSFWQWLTVSERVRFFAQLDCFFDAPAATLKTLVFAPTLSVELSTSGHRGLRDLSPQQVPFRAFQERGSARFHASPTGRLPSLPSEKAP